MTCGPCPVTGELSKWKTADVSELSSVTESAAMLFTVRSEAASVAGSQG